MIVLRPFDHHLALSVIANLDPWDLMEAEATRGARATHLAIFADWCAIEGARVSSAVVCRQSTNTPIAIMALLNTGQAGVASAAMLARDHRGNRRDLVALARYLRWRMPEFCADQGIHRIEARAWAHHPRASRFLNLIGFSHETDMPGFGPAGSETFRQFAFVPDRHMPQRS